MSPDNTPFVYQFFLSLGTLYKCRSWRLALQVRPLNPCSQGKMRDADRASGPWPGVQGQASKSQWSLALRTEPSAAKSLACLALFLHIL